MSKKIVLLIVILLSFTSGVFIVIIGYNRQPKVGVYCLEDYQWELEYFPSDKQVCAINDAETAIKEAKKLWEEEFPKEWNDDIYRRKIEVFYDSQNECWLVSRILPSNWDGTVPCAIIQTDGKVLAVFMG